MNPAPAVVPLAPSPTPAADPTPAATRPGWPWRSATAGWVAAAAVVAVGLPLFLRMPLWIDVTLYDVAARNILTGGVHYRDVFDTNPPGFVWCVCLLRPLIGPSSEAIRAVDLAVVAAVLGLLAGWARRAGGTAAGTAWAVAGSAGFYLFISEFNHCQRDVWMMLPAGLAAAYRLARVRAARREPVTDGWVFRTAVLEAIVWGLAAWVKPHVVLVAAAAWAAVQGRLGGSAGAGRAARLRRTGADLAGALLGGSAVGLAGLAWLVGTGAWEPFLEVFSVWNREYISIVIGQTKFRLYNQFDYFPPWTVLFVLAVPLAVLNVIDGRLWAADDRAPAGPVGRRLAGWVYDSPADPGPRFARAVLAAVYLAWFGVALFLQKEYHYVHAPEILLMLAVFAANRWAVAVAALAAQVAVMAWAEGAAPGVIRWENRPPLARAVVWAYPDRDPARLRWWPGCFSRRVPPELRNGVAFQSDHFGGVDWVEFPEVEAFLRAAGVGDGEVMCWNDGTHPLYLSLGVRPPIRFMHLSTVCILGDDQRRKVEAEVAAAAAAGRVRFVVTDLVRVTYNNREAWAGMSAHGPGPDDLLPPVIPPAIRARLFPLNQPAVFRSGRGAGRYVVHALTNPVGTVALPQWEPRAAAPPTTAPEPPP